MALSKRKKAEKEAKRNELNKAISAFITYALKFELMLGKEELLGFFTNPKTQKSKYTVLTDDFRYELSMFMTGSLFSRGCRSLHLRIS